MILIVVVVVITSGRTDGDDNAEAAAEALAMALNESLTACQDVELSHFSRKVRYWFFNSSMVKPLGASAGSNCAGDCSSSLSRVAAAAAFHRVLLRFPPVVT